MRGPLRQPLLPIPEDASYEDPLWEGRFSDLANAMVQYGAKPAIIRRFTGMANRQISLRYARLRDGVAKPGRLKSGLPRRFAIRQDRSSYDFILQSAVFAQVCMRIEDSFNKPLNRGWLLVAAYRAYCRLTEQMVKHLEIAPLDIDAAYDLMCHIGSTRYRQMAALQQRGCTSCGTQYLVLSDVEHDGQCCPMCAIDKRYRHLVEQNELKRRAVSS